MPFSDPLIFNEAQRQQKNERLLKQNLTDIQRIWQRMPQSPDSFGIPQTGKFVPERFAPPVYCNQTSTLSYSTGGSESCSTSRAGGSEVIGYETVSSRSTSTSTSNSTLTTKTLSVSNYSCSNSLSYKASSISNSTSRSCSHSTASHVANIQSRSTSCSGSASTRYVPESCSWSASKGTNSALSQSVIWIDPNVAPSYSGSTSTSASNSASRSTSTSNSCSVSQSASSVSTSAANCSASTSTSASTSGSTSASCSVSTVGDFQNTCGCRLPDQLTLEITASDDETTLPLQTITIAWDNAESLWFGVLSYTGFPDPGIVLVCTGSSVADLELEAASPDGGASCSPVSLTYTNFTFTVNATNHTLTAVITASAGDLTSTGFSTSNSCSDSRSNSTSTSASTSTSCNYSSATHPGSNSTSCSNSTSRSRSTSDSTSASRSVSRSVSCSNNGDCDFTSVMGVSLSNFSSYSKSLSCLLYRPETSVANHCSTTETQSTSTHQGIYLDCNFMNRSSMVSGGSSLMTSCKKAYVEKTSSTVEGTYSTSARTTYSYSRNTSTIGGTSTKTCSTSTGTREVVSISLSCKYEDRPYP